MQMLDFFLSDSREINKMAFLWVLAYLLTKPKGKAKGQKRNFRETLGTVAGTYLFACHLSVGVAEVTGYGAGWIAFLIGAAGGLSAENLLNKLLDKLKDGNDINFGGNADSAADVDG